MYRPADHLCYSLQSIAEHCDKGNLAHAIRCGLFRARAGARTELVARRMLLRTASEICRGMIHLHAASVVHGGCGGRTTCGAAHPWRVCRGGAGGWVMPDLYMYHTNKVHCNSFAKQTYMPASCGPP